MSQQPVNSDEPIAPIEASEVSRWDADADVVVVGFGAAGSTAAFTAAEAGAEVIVVERTGGSGGAAALAEGIVYLGGGRRSSRPAGSRTPSRTCSGS
jgi:3-oxo-5alpha-steroid 4-dehydrogenase